MLLRFTVENFLSFKDAVEFNLFPSSKSHNHNNHRVNCGSVTGLRMSALYGANGAGKSNLIGAMTLLKNIVQYGLKVIGSPDDFCFRFSEECKAKPSSFAIEFSIGDVVLYYQIEFDGKLISSEALYRSLKSTDELIFSRGVESPEEKITLNLTPKYFSNKLTSDFKDAIVRILRPDQTLLQLFGEFYSSSSEVIANAYGWIVRRFRILTPAIGAETLPFMLYNNPEFFNMVNKELPLLKTGVDQLVVNSEELVLPEAQAIYKEEIEKAKKDPGTPIPTDKTMYEGIVNIVFVDGHLYKLTMQPQHKMTDGHLETTPYTFESDGTHRLIDFMPMLYYLKDKDNVFVVDEIERSIHPIMIKELMRTISDSETMKGQLIFTTHESCLLDQDIFRPDEIWFAQKDVEQATQLYPLSDFNIHNTANIENGYLQGRYGGIPFLSNLNDLNWK